MAQPTKAESVEIKQESPKWVTLTEAEKLEKYLFKNFVPKNDEKFSKKYFYRVEAIIPYTPASLEADPEQHLYKFMIQKYYRDRKETVSVAASNGSRQDIEREAKVEGHEMFNGKWQCVDPQANRLVDSSDFKRDFEADSAE